MVLKRGIKLMSHGYTIKFIPEDYERIREEAEKEHLSPIPWIRQKILNILDKTEDD